MLSAEYLQTSEHLQKKILEIVSEQFEPHPFANKITLENMEEVFRNYLAFSKAFPYLQAGSQKELIFHCLDMAIDVSEDIEATSVVANFLCWDETGGYSVLLEHGIEGLPLIINTQSFFHSNIFKKDAYLILGKDIEPSYSNVTREYLYHLYEGLSSLNSVVRCAAMVAFETHAGQMINGMWNRVVELCDVNKDSLAFFITHVDGDNSSEPSHIKMTSRMIDKIVPENQIDAFLQAFKYAYNLSYCWCRDITEL